MKILHLETSSKNCSVAISDGDEILCVCEEISENYKQSESLHTFVQWALEGAKITLDDLDAISLGKGPGSYTGLRIGASSAKGFCFGLQIPLVAVNSLETMIQPFLNKEYDFIIPMIDARRMEVFNAIYDKSLNTLKPVSAEIITEESYQTNEEEIHFLGDGASKCKEFLHKSNFIFYDEIIYPSAKQMSLLSFEKYKNSDTVDVAYFEPLYVKDFMITKKKAL